MSVEYDDKIVRMQFDNKGFESGIQTTLRSLENLKASLNFNNAAIGIDEMTAGLKNLSLDNLTTGIERTIIKIPVMGTVMDQTIRNMTNSVEGFIKQTLDKFSAIGNAKAGFGEYELQIGAIKTIAASTGRPLEEINGYLEDLNKYADDTIYSFSDMTQNIGKFTNAGVELGDAVNAIKGVANVAAVSGANTQEASRAMYNFAQALSQGSVKLIDWKSIENANMATVEFKNELLKTALEFGTIRKEGDKYISTTTDLTGHVSTAFDATSMFNESLSHQWLTTDVLVKTLNNYTDTTTDIGQKATEAATKVNTFHQAMDAIVEGLGSSWAQSWQYIVGDFEDATAMWTKFKDVIEGIFKPSNDARNEMLKFWATGKTESEQTIELTEEAKKKYQELFDVANRGVLGDFGNGEARVTALTNAGYDYAEVQGIINQMVSGSIKSWEDLARAEEKANDTQVEGMTGREMALKGFSNLTTAIGKFVGAIKTAWDQVFPKKDGNRLVKMSEAFMKFTEKLIISDKTANEITRTFRGLFSIIKIGVSIIKAVTKGLGALFSAIVSGGEKSSGTFWTITAAIGDVLYSIGELLTSSDALERIFVSIGTTIGAIIHTIIAIMSALIAIVAELIANLLGLDTVEFSLDSVVGVFASASEAISGFVVSITDKIESFGFIPVTGIETFTANVKNALSFFTQESGPLHKVIDFFIAAWDKLKTGLQVIGAVLAPVVDFIKSKLEDLVGGELTFENFINFLKDGGALILLGELIGIIHNLRKLFGDFVGVGSATKNMLDAFTGSAKAMTARLKVMTLKLLASALFQIALAIGVMVAAVWALSKMDTEELKKGLLAFTAIMVELMLVLDKMKASQLAGAAGVLASLGVGVFLLTKALLVLGKADAGEVIFGLMYMSVVLEVLTDNLARVTSARGTVEGAAKTIIAMAAAMILLLIPLKSIAKMKFWELMQGLFGIIALMAVLSKSMQAIQKYGRSGNLDGVASTLLALSFSLTLLMIPLKIMAGMKFTELLQGLFGVLTMVAILSAAMIAISKYGGNFDLADIGMLWSIVAAIIIMNMITIKLTEIGWGDVGKAAAVIGGSLGILLLFVFLLNKILYDAHVDELMGVLVSIIALVGVLGLIMISLGKLSTSKQVGAIVGVIAIAIAIVIISLSLGLLAKTLSKPGLDQGVNNVSKLFISFGASMLLLAVCILILVKTFKMLNEMKISDNLMNNMAAFGSFLLLFVENIIGGAIGALIASGPAIVSAIFATISMVLDELGKNIEEWIEKTIGIITSVIDGIANGVDDIVTSVIGLIDNTLDSLAKNQAGIKRIAENLVVVICAFIEGLTSPKSLGAIADTIIDFIDNLATMLEDEKRVKRAADSLFRFVKAVIKAVGTMVERIYNLVKEEIIDPLMEKITNKIGEVVESSVSKIVKSLEELINRTIDLLNKIPGVDLDDVDLDEEGAGSKAKSLAKKSVKQGIDTVAHMINPVGYLWETGKKFHLFAKGGTYNPNNVIVGEAGPELLSSRNGRSVVTPLSNSNARSTTKGIMDRYTSDITKQLSSIEGSLNQNRNAYENTKYDDSYVRKAISSVTESVDSLSEEMSNLKVYLDGKALVGQLVGPMDEALGNRAVRRRK
jgi:tape measure domain-containing protein